VDIKPGTFHAMPGYTATFFCQSDLLTVWDACDVNISSKSFQIKRLPGNILIARIGPNHRALFITNIIEEHYGSYCCRNSNIENGPYYFNYAKLVKGDYKPQMSFKTLKSL